MKYYLIIKRIQVRSATLTNRNMEAEDVGAHQGLGVHHLQSPYLLIQLPEPGHHRGVHSTEL